MKVLEFENINNVRDLGGLKTTDGFTVKNNKLIRGVALQKASSNDLNKLVDAHKLSYVVDFRTKREATEKPFPGHLLPNVEYKFLPPISEVTTLMAQDSKAQEKAIELVKAMTPEYCKEIMKDNYKDLACLESSKSAYSEFFKTLLNNKEGSCYWHCSLGKDRTGVAALLILHVLDVPYNDIQKDYMLTNDAQRHNLNTIVSIIEENLHIKIDRESIKQLQYADLDYLDTYIKTVKEISGDLNSYIENELKVDSEMRAQLKDIYLTKN